MSLRLEMLQVARLSRKQLRDSADLIVRFTQGQMNEDGGFRNRDGASDLYYTVFGVESLIALGVEARWDSLASYLRTCEEGSPLDFVHLACLARAWGNLPKEMRGDAPRESILERIESHRSEDGGYSPARGSRQGTVYACFLALGAYQDLEAAMPDPRGMLPCIESVRAEYGGYANRPGLAQGLTPTTAAAVSLLRHLEQPLPPDLGDWLLSRCHPEGGFFASPQAPMPDLLSTATALHALSSLDTSLGTLRESCIDFVDTLWTNQGGFYGSWTDDIVDCEYTYYALLALGHLSL